jgi:hypothetical protein
LFKFITKKRKNNQFLKHIPVLSIHKSQNNTVFN